MPNFNTKIKFFYKYICGTSGTSDNWVIMSSRNSRASRHRRYVFTFNNYTDEDIEHICSFDKSEIEYFFSKEVGLENGTPHLQGFVKFRNGRSMNAINKKFFRNHARLDVMRGSIEDNVTYCSKQSVAITNIEIPEKFREPIAVIKTEDDLYPWQLECVNLVRDWEDPRSRTVNWFWEPSGGVGKSELVNYLVDNHNAICCGGSKRDALVVFYQRHQARINTKIVIFDLERSAKNHVSYRAIESLKNCCAFSAKYESGFFRFAPVHVVIFSNYPPDVSELTEVKWNIVKCVV